MNQTNKRNSSYLQRKAECQTRAECHAVILAAGSGIRTTPMRRDIPKGLIEIAGERLIERLIRQLHDAGVYSIAVVVGYEGSRYGYLESEFNVEIIKNPLYSTKNNIYSLFLAADWLEDCFIVPCDVWCKNNPFQGYIDHSWYLVSNGMDNANSVCIDSEGRLCGTKDDQTGNSMVGIAYMDPCGGAALRRALRALLNDPENDGLFWESALMNSSMPQVYANIIRKEDYIEINTYEDLRKYSNNPEQLNSEVIEAITAVLGVSSEEICSIKLMKKGMTNRSFTFVCGGERYIMRIPGEGTDRLINRAQEFKVYQCIQKDGFTDEVLYFNPNNGYKLSKYWIDSRVCDPMDEADLSRCMRFLREFHERTYCVDHMFDVFERIEFYESLRAGTPSVHKEYAETKRNVFSLRPFLKRYAAGATLTHIDAVPDNFLIKGDLIRLIDWEYAGMADPHIDIAMFIIYALYDKPMADRLIDLYFYEGCKPQLRTKIYGYIAACGLLWSNWCEYKRMQGVRFDEYEDIQFAYARDYYEIAAQAITRPEI